MENQPNDEDGTTPEATGREAGAAISSLATSAVGQGRQEWARLAARGAKSRQRVAEANLTTELLREWLHYDPETGMFTWVRLGRNTKIGAQAGALRGDGYIIIGVCKSQFLAHRLAWFYVHGEWPQQLMDHRNGKRADNRLDNLRCGDRRLNRENQREAGNATGFLGVRRNRCGGFEARIGSHDVEHSLGTYPTPEEAHAVYVAAKRNLHRGCTI